MASLISFDDGRVVRQFKQPFPIASPVLRWTPDGRFVTYVVTRGGVSNIWGQPAEGGEAKQLTAWTADLIYRFDWSKDGTLACERGAPVNDVVLLRDAGGD
jgi:Tol biopolymer transport system component